MNFFERQWWRRVVRRGRPRAYGSVYFLLCGYNKKSCILAGFMPFIKDVCLFITLFECIFSSLWWLPVLNLNEAMYGSFSVLVAALIHRVFCRLRSVFRISEKPIVIIISLLYHHYEEKWKLKGYVKWPV